jgi:hypothetical protein
MAMQGFDDGIEIDRAELFEQGSENAVHLLVGSCDDSASSKARRMPSSLREFTNAE